MLVAILKFVLVLGLVHCAKLTRQADTSSDSVLLGRKETMCSENLGLGVHCRVSRVQERRRVMPAVVVMVSLCGPSVGTAALKETQTTCQSTRTFEHQKI